MIVQIPYLPKHEIGRLVPVKNAQTNEEQLAKIVHITKNEKGQTVTSVSLIEDTEEG